MTGHLGDPGTCPSCGSALRAERAYVPGSTGMPVTCGNDWHEEGARGPGDYPDFEAILNLPVDNEYLPGDIRTIRDYLIRLLSDVWKDGEGFNGKRPFGDSGWESDLITPLVRAGLVKGKLDADGYIDSVDDEAAEKLIADTIIYLGKPR